MIEVEKIYRFIIIKMVKSIYKKNITLEDLKNIDTGNTELSLLIKAIDVGLKDKKVTVGSIREQIKLYPKQLGILERLRR